MFSIITRYLFREILKTSAATVLVLFVILLSNALGRVLSEIAAGNLPYLALWPVMLTQSVNILSLLLPIGFFFGIIMAFGRLYKDHEIVVMNACGMGYAQFYKPVALVILPVFLISMYCSVWLNSETQAVAQRIIERAQNLHEFKHVKPGQFNQSKSGEHVFFMESLSDDKRQLNNVIVSETGRENMFLETAESGRQITDDVSGSLFMLLENGKMYQGQPGQKDFKIVEYEQHGILVRQKSRAESRELRDKAVPSADLWNSNKLEDRIELHWRIAIPVVVLVLAMLAVPLSHMMPRQGRYGKLGYALLVYICYFNLMIFARAKLEAGSISLTINFWWVHFLFVLLTLWLLLKRNGGYRLALGMVRR